MDLLKISGNLTDDKLKFVNSAIGKSPITVDYTPPLGSGEGYASLELFLISLGTCLSSTVKIILAFQLGKEITGVEYEMEGERKEEHPTCFKRINMVLSLKGRDLEKETIEQAVKAAEEKFCPVLAMLDQGIEFALTTRIL